MLVWLFIFWHVVALDIAKSHLPLPGGMQMCHVTGQSHFATIFPPNQSAHSEGVWVVGTIQSSQAWVGDEPALLLGAGMCCFPSTAAGMGLLAVQESHRWKYHVFCMGWAVGGERLHPSPSWPLSSIPSIRLSWISKSSFCIARPWHQWAMTLGCEPLVIGVNQRTRDEQKGDC